MRGLDCYKISAFALISWLVTRQKCCVTTAAPNYITIFSSLLARPRAPGPMRTQMAPQASMQMRRGMPRGMAPTRNVSALPQATVHRLDEGVYATTPYSRRPPENVQSRTIPSTYGKSDLQRLNTSVATT